MDWEAIGAASENVAAVAVCVTLIFLTIQLRQSNKSQKTAAYQTYIDARTALQVSLLQPEANAALLGTSFAPLSRTNEQLQDYHQVLHLSMTYFAMAFRLWKDGLLSDDQWNAHLSILSEFNGTEGFRLWWPAVSNFYAPDFVEAVDWAELLTTGLERFIEAVEAARSSDQK
ncbi:MAG: hypothetical protein CMQ24_20605 [Gammaproteobacteria bacterium]|nr:hypothetical protein [Gammaproteobacteria bacterium]